MDYAHYLEDAIDDILVQYHLPRSEAVNVIQPITYERAAILNNIAYWEDVLTRRYPEYKQGNKAKYIVKALKSAENVHDYLALFESMVVPALLNKGSQWNPQYGHLENKDFPSNQVIFDEHYPHPKYSYEEYRAKLSEAVAKNVPMKDVTGTEEIKKNEFVDLPGRLELKAEDYRKINKLLNGYYVNQKKSEDTVGKVYLGDLIFGKINNLHLNRGSLVLRSAFFCVLTSITMNTLSAYLRKVDIVEDKFNLALDALLRAANDDKIETDGFIKLLKEVVLTPLYDANVILLADETDVDEDTITITDTTETVEPTLSVTMLVEPDVSEAPVTEEKEVEKPKKKSTSKSTKVTEKKATKPKK